MKKIRNISIMTGINLMAFVILCLIVTNACVPSKAIANKSGIQLWAENCQRCHNTPPPNAFSSEQWETIGLHMQSRALITEQERIKIVEFLKSSH